MLNIRRRSTAWMKELVNSSHRIDVASLETATASEEHELGNKSDRVELGISEIQATQISLEEIIRADGQEPDEPRVDEVDSRIGTRKKHYLEHYILFLHGVGLASFREYWSKVTSPTHIVHKTLFWILGTLAVSDSVKMMKVCNVLFVDNGNLYRYIVVCRHGLNCAKRICFLSVFSTGSKQILKVFDEVRALKDTSAKDSKGAVIAFGVGLTSIAMAVIGAMFGLVTIGQEWLLSKGVLLQSFEMSLSLFIWTTNTTKAEEEYATLQKLYAQDFTPVTLSFGILGIVMESLGFLLDYANADIMLFSAMVMYNLTKEFQLKMLQKDSTMDEILKQYGQLQNVSECIETAFGRLFKVSHANNLLSCAYFVLIIVTSTEYYAWLIFLVLQILKVCLTYYLAIWSTGVNKYLRRWARSGIINCDTMDYDAKLRVSTVVEDSIESPVGLGSENFFVDEAFLLKFATMVGTFSLFLIESERKLEPV